MDILFLIVGLLTIDHRSNIATANPMGRKTNSTNVCNTEACKETAKELLESIDFGVSPCDDFYQYACGGWIEKNPILPNRLSTSKSGILQAKIYNQLKEIYLNPPEASTNLKAAHNARNLFFGCIDQESRDEAGTQPIKDLLDELGGWPMQNPNDWSGDNYKWSNAVAKSIRTIGESFLFSIGILPDEKNRENYIIYLGEPSLSLTKKKPDNDTGTEEEGSGLSPGILAYIKYISMDALILGANIFDDYFVPRLVDMLNFELDLSEFLSDKKSRNPEDYYRKMTIAELQQQTGDETFSWKNFLNTVLSDLPQLQDSTEIVMESLDYFKRVIPFVQNSDKGVVADFIGWKVLFTVGTSSTLDFRVAEFIFEKIIYGRQEPRSLIAKCIHDVTETFDFMIERFYIDKRYYNTSSNSDIKTMIEMLREVYEKEITENKWMDDFTTRKAIEKLNAMISLVGYPEWITNDRMLEEYYKEIEPVNPKTYFVSQINAYRTLIKKTLNKWNQKTDRTSWVSPATEVNAYYDLTGNAVTLPFAILQEPYYDIKRVESLNYGGIGTVMGHEISHAFDDQGSRYDKNGNLINWWTKETRKEFDQKTECFRKQYNRIIEPNSGKHLNGNRSLGENTADNAGVINAYKAYQKHITLEKSKGHLPQTLPSLDATPEQLFFLGFASIWCSNERKSIMEALVNEVHAPNKFRVNVPLSNFDKFSEAFNCPSGSPMNPTKKCVLW